MVMMVKVSIPPFLVGGKCYSHHDHGSNFIAKTLIKLDIDLVIFLCAEREG